MKEKEKQIKTKKRVVDHGEVYTSKREVNAMLDLVKHETERIDSVFLEPACGSGNFLAEILRRKLIVVKKRYSKRKKEYEKNSLIAIYSIYGVDILLDNILECRNRLFNIFNKEYKDIFNENMNTEFRKTVKFILDRNILLGDALTMKALDGNPIIFSQWSFMVGDYIKRNDYKFEELIREKDEQTNFNDLKEINYLNGAFIPEPVKSFKPINYRRIFNVK